MNRAPGTDGPEDVNATFAKIVADLRAEGFGSDSDTDDLMVDADENDDTTGGRGWRKLDPSADHDADPPPATGWREAGVGWDETMLGDGPTDAADGDDEHYIPPEPPPLPRPRKGAVVVLLFFVVGVAVLVAPGVIGLSRSIGVPLGMLLLASGITLALLRVRQGPPDGADPTNGAQV